MLEYTYFNLEALGFVVDTFRVRVEKSWSLELTWNWVNLIMETVNVGCLGWNIAKKIPIPNPTRTMRMIKIRIDQRRQRQQPKDVCSWWRRGRDG